MQEPQNQPLSGAARSKNSLGGAGVGDDGTSLWVEVEVAREPTDEEGVPTVAGYVWLKKCASATSKVISEA